LLRELKEALQGIYGERLRRVVLYGSYAREEAVEGSDVDVMVVLDRVEDPLAERESLSGLIFELSLKYHVVLSVLLVGEEEFLKGRSPLFLNVRREGVTL